MKPDPSNHSEPFGRERILPAQAGAILVVLGGVGAPAGGGEGGVAGGEVAVARREVLRRSPR